jgi:hypothetical protein
MEHSHARNDYELLETLIVDNPDLEQLEARLDQFNIFEALGAVRVELRHSDFLAFLLNPNQSHGLGDQFVKRLLQRALATAPDKTPIRPIDLDVADMDTILVLREWHNIDILLLDEENELAVIIENKIGSNEHSDQLRRYLETVRQHYPEFRQICLFLTPEGEEPSNPKFVPVSYSMIAELVEELIESRATTLGPDVRTLMAHYGQMLRRHIVSESEIAELCRKIYRKHQRALDLIYEYRPDQQESIREILENLVQAEDSLELDHTSKSSIRFVPTEWDVPVLMEGKGWTRSGRMLLFEFGNHPDRLALYLIIGPGPLDTRQKLMDIAKENRPLKPAFSALGKLFNTIYKFSFLSEKSYEDASTDDLEAEIKKKWAQFLARELPNILEIMKQEAWIWA